MESDSVQLTSISKLFEYEKISREIENCNDMNELKNISKCYVKLYFALEEMIQNLNLMPTE
jgi:hypothetical protein